MFTYPKPPKPFDKSIAKILEDGLVFGPAVSLRLARVATAMTLLLWAGAGALGIWWVWGQLTIRTTGDIALASIALLPFLKTSYNLAKNASYVFAIQVTPDEDT